MILLLPQPVGQALLDYLSTRPYREVFQLIAALQSLEEQPEEPVEE